MLFNSYPFIFIFLPIVFAGMFLIGRFSHRLAALWLALSSLTFYGVWDSRFILLLLISICFNYGFGYIIGHHLLLKKQMMAKRILYMALAFNLCLLGYFKYADFFITSSNTFFGTNIPGLEIILPLGISFFTFTQIAYLMDVHRGIAREYSFIHYLLFVTYFPHLIAGPILHHKQMMPQFALASTYKINLNNTAVGLSIFILGLAKKVLIADQFAQYATPIFEAAENGILLTLIEAWVGALAYTLQLYFDFSAYCDMAIGLSLMLNVRLPMNFNSPYKATNIIDFWCRWNITLSAFLKDYLYIPLGGNRKGKFQRYVNLMITMLLGGLWHGAGWTFVIWGGLHGLYLIINHVWRGFKSRTGIPNGGKLARLGATLITFFAVVIAWVFFRAESFSGAFGLLSGMFGTNGLSLPGMLSPLASSHSFSPQLISYQGLFPDKYFILLSVLPFLILGLAIVWMCPNLREVFSLYKPTWEDISSDGQSPALSSRITFTFRPAIAVGIGIIASFTLIYMLEGQPSEFLYFQF